MDEWNNERQDQRRNKANTYQNNEFYNKKVKCLLSRFLQNTYM